MPDRQVIEQWVTALESGDYAQAKRTLNRVTPHPTEEHADYAQTGFCCLGVLCDLAVKAGVIEAPTVNRRGEAEYGGAEGGTAFLPPEVRDWAGLLGNNPEVNYERAKYWNFDVDESEVYTATGPLSDLNDEQGKAFPEIAQIIRENFLAHADAGQPA